MDFMKQKAQNFPLKTPFVDLGYTVFLQQALKTQGSI